MTGWKAGDLKQGGQRMGFIARAFEYYEGLPHQREAIAKLEGMVPPHCVEAFAKVFSPSDDLEYCLPVPFMSQLDNALMAHRTCNPSSCAMCLEFLEPGMINGDDDLIVEMEKRAWDVTNHTAMTKILRLYGLESVFRFDLTKHVLENEIRNGRPVVLGILHKGPADKPWGGHMIVAVGLDPAENAVICHDPYGSLLDGYSGSAESGKFVRYPWSELRGRWLVEGPESGWGRIFLTSKTQETPNGHYRAA